MLEISAPLTTVGLIATIMSIAFAIAAFLNSRRHRHPPVSPPAPSANKSYLPKFHGIKSPLPLSSDAHEKDSPTPAVATPVFKQMGPSGAETLDNQVRNNDYHWE